MWPEGQRYVFLRGGDRTLHDHAVARLDVLEWREVQVAMAGERRVVGLTRERRARHMADAPEQRARVLASLSPFDYEAWVREAGPPTIEELAEMEEFLRGREVERRQSLADEEARGERFFSSLLAPRTRP